MKKNKYIDTVDHDGNIVKIIRNKRKGSLNELPL